MTSSILKGLVTNYGIDRLRNENKRRQLLKLYTFLKIHHFHKWGGGGWGGWGGWGGCEGQDGRRARFWSSVNFAPGKSVRLSLMKLGCLPGKHYGYQL